MTKKLLFIGATALFAMACGGNTATVNTNANTANVTNTANIVNTVANAPTNTANSANTTNTATPANANKAANTTAAKPAPSGPKRVAFAAGKSEGSESVSLAAGESKQFVFGARNGQIFMAEADSKDLEITMVKGKDTAPLKEPGYYDSTLLADGDFVFQVKNNSKKEVKSSVKIIISDTSASKK
jgi:hypothetical protein